MKNYLVYIFFFFFLNVVFSQNQLIEISNEMDIVRMSSISKKQKEVEFALPIFKTPNQSLVKWICPSSTDSFRVDEGAKKITFSLPKLKKKKKFKIDLNVQIKVRPYFYNDFLKFDYPEFIDSDTAKYLLLSEISIEEVKLLKNIINVLKDKDRHLTLTAMINFLHRDFTMDKIKMSIANRIKEVLKTEKLSPGEASNLLLAMCRVANIPSRIVTGHVVRKDQKKGFTLYSWVEVYISGKGWVNYDPYFSTFSNNWVENHSSDYYFIAYKYEDNLLKSNTHTSTLKSPYQTFNDVTFNNINDEYYRKGEFFYQRHNNKLAIIHFDSLLAINAYDYNALVKKAIAEARMQKFDDGLNYLQLAQKFTENETQESKILYAFANYYALKREKEKFLTFLEASLEKGFQGYDIIMLDTDLAFYRKDLDFLKIVKKLKSLQTK